MNLMRFVVAVLVLVELSNSASASPLFARAVKDNYRLGKLPGCATCHMSGDDPATGQPYTKEVRNDFGKLFAIQLEGKMIVARMAQSKAAGDARSAADEAGNAQDAAKFEAEKQQIDDAIIKDFLEALKKVEPQKHSSGDTYQKILQAGNLERLKIKE